MHHFALSLEQHLCTSLISSQSDNGKWWKFDYLLIKIIKQWKNRISFGCPLVAWTSLNHIRNWNHLRTECSHSNNRLASSEKPWHLRMWVNQFSASSNITHVSEARRPHIRCMIVSYISHIEPYYSEHKRHVVWRQRALLSRITKRTADDRRLR